ncbi:MAG: ABC transporter permease subunit/CPBP intramembrane protease [Candidatus Eremiobacteraeota bacterium]|nr:ABC transporter permease subunit/CPBP intramembrane protease [Candidatus Eremiobacteraeota bacterium]
MNMRRVKTLYAKEIKEILRNWGLIILLIFFPLIVYPSTLIFMAEFGVSQMKKLESQKTRVAVKGRELAPELIPLLEEKEGLILEFTDDAKVSAIPSKYKSILSICLRGDLIDEKVKNIAMDLYFDSTDEESKLSRLRMEEVLLDYKKELIYRRLEAKNLSTDFMEPIRLKFDNVATKNKIAGAHLGEVLPLILITFIMLGTIQVAVDLTAGEKERKTMQTLILSPLSRLEIITSKLLVVLTTTLFTTAVNFLSVGLTIYFVYNFTQKAKELTISFPAIMLSLVLAVPLVVLMSALFLMVGIMAKNQLEANIYVLPILFVGLLPAGLPSIPGLKYDTWMSLIPIANTALMVKAIFLGTYTMLEFALTFLSNSLYAVLVIIFMSRLFQKEDIAFGGLSDIIFQKIDRTRPTAGEVILFFLGALAVYFFIGNNLQQKHMQAGLVASQVLLLLVPALYFVKRSGYDVKKVFKLRNFKPQVLVLAPLIGLGTLVLSQYMEKFQSYFIQTPHELEAFMTNLLTFHGFREGLFVFLVIAVTPAVIEELVFRGLILSGLEHSLTKVTTCLLVGFLFALFHLNLYILIPVTLMGALLTYVVMRTDSIYTGMLMHFTINGTQVALLNFVSKDINIPPYAWLIAIAAIVGGIALLPRPAGENEKKTEPL